MISCDQHLHPELHLLVRGKVHPNAGSDEEEDPAYNARFAKRKAPALNAEASFNHN
jgi:hypothetical protein